VENFCFANRSLTGHGPYVLPVLWMMSYWPVIDEEKVDASRAYTQSHSPGAAPGRSLMSAIALFVRCCDGG